MIYGLYIINILVGFDINQFLILEKNLQNTKIVVDQIGEIVTISL